MNFLNINNFIILNIPYKLLYSLLFIYYFKLSKLYWDLEDYNQSKYYYNILLENDQANGEIFYYLGFIANQNLDTANQDLDKLNDQLVLLSQLRQVHN